jgi:hypothetical protein
MSWWEYVMIAAVFLVGIYAFLVLTRFLTGLLSYGSRRTADDAGLGIRRGVRPSVCVVRWDAGRSGPRAMARLASANASRGCCATPWPASRWRRYAGARQVT